MVVAGDDYADDGPRGGGGGVVGGGGLDRRGQLDDMEWTHGNRSIAEEALDKVKEFVSGIKIFDSHEDYG